MVQVAIEVQSGGANLRLVVRAESIQRTTALADNRFPIELECFFVGGPPVEELRFERPEAVAV